MKNSQSARMAAMTALSSFRISFSFPGIAGGRFSITYTILKNAALVKRKRAKRTDLFLPDQSVFDSCSLKIRATSASVSRCMREKSMAAI